MTDYTNCNVTAYIVYIKKIQAIAQTHKIYAICIVIIMHILYCKCLQGLCARSSIICDFIVFYFVYVSCSCPSITSPSTGNTHKPPSDSTTAYCLPGPTHMEYGRPSSRPQLIWLAHTMPLFARAVPGRAHAGL